MRAVIVQARLRSARFLGKILAPWDGGTILSTVLKRCTKIKADDYLLATDQESFQLVLPQVFHPWEVFAGEPENVLKRFVDCMDWIEKHKTTMGDDGVPKWYHVTEVVRICADSPFIDPLTANLCCDAHDPDNYASTYPKIAVPGLAAGVVSAWALRKLYASDPTPEECEHVTLGIKNRPEFKNQEIDLGLWVDTPEQYERLLEYQEFSR